jgi:hypothetical protein
MDKKIQKECSVHGLTEYRLRKDGRYRCGQCNTDAVIRRRHKVKQMAVEYKGGECEICGYKKYIGALQFHHMNPNEKDFNVSQKGHTRSWNRVKSEIDKCILVCANCHAEIHSNEIQIMSGG